MAVDDGLDEIQAQPDARFVQRARAVGFVEAVEDKGQVVRRDRLSPVADGDVGLSVVLVQADRDAAALLGKLHGIVDEVVDHLGDPVAVRADQDVLLRQLRIDVQAFLRCAALEAQERLQDQLRQIKDRALGRVGRPVAHLRDVQHLAHEAGEALGLVADRAEIFLLLLLGDRAVEDAVGKAGDRRHRRAQLVGDVGDEFASARLGLLQRGGHLVERFDQRAHLVGGILDLLYAHREIAAGEFARGRRHLIERAGHALGIKEADDKRDRKHADRDQHRDAKKRLPRAEHVGRYAGDEGIADHALFPVEDRLGDDIALFRIERTERRHPAHPAVFRKLLDHGFGETDADMLAARALVRAAHDLAALVGEKDVVACAVGDRADAHAQLPGVQPVIVRHGGGQVADLLGARFHRRLIVVDDIAARDADKGDRRQKEADGNERCRCDKISQINAFHGSYSVTSNL